MGGRKIMKKRLGSASAYSFVISSVTILLLLNFGAVEYPEITQKVTGLNTSTLQEDTAVNVSVNANQTTSTGAVEQAKGIVALYTNPSTSNRILLMLFTLYLVVIGLIVFDKGWIG